jgi:hypothetical protein
MSAARWLTIALLTAGVVTHAGAQVGTTPEKSPFRDLEKRQDVGLVFGISTGGRDLAGAAPRGGSAIGVRYDLGLGNSPLSFTSMLVRQSASRDILQPGLPVANRIGATVSQPLYFVDLGFSLRLTGNKSWRNVVPAVTAGVGIVTDNRAVTDSSLFKFGNRFNIQFGLGMKYAPQRSRWTVRGDITNRFYSVPYPATFRTAPTGVATIVGPNVNGKWTRNTMLTVGIVREIGRR